MIITMEFYIKYIMIGSVLFYLLLIVVDTLIQLLKRMRNDWKIRQHNKRIEKS